MTKLKIKVTKQILEESKMCSNNLIFAVNNCAIALSIKNIFPHAEVWSTYINVYEEFGYIGRIELPSSAKEFIRAFNVSSIEQRLAMPEIEFEVEIPDEIIERISIEELRPLLENHPTLELIN